MSLLTLDLVFVGFGNVARQFVEILGERATELRHTEQLELRLVGITTKRHGAVLDWNGLDGLRALTAAAAGTITSLAPERQARDTLHVLEQLSDRPSPAPCIVVETTPLEIMTGEPATSHIRAAFAAGASVVTANKGPIAHHFAELQAAAEQRNVCFRFESTVMDGAPIFGLARETLPLITVTAFRGVVNSTTNHIITAMERGEAYDEALHRMQREGMTEADPSLDVDGWDAAAKTAALINVLMGGRTRPQDITRTGIGHLTARAAQEAVSRGRRIRLVASAVRVDGHVKGLVAPAELPEDDWLAKLTGTQNGLILQTDLLGELAVLQLDGGLTQTAYGLLADIVSIGRALKSRAG